MVDAAALSQFHSGQWATYRKLVEGDYLAHRAVGNILHETLNEVFTAAFSFLDIACGDASIISGRATRHPGAPLSRHRPVKQAALELAAANLAGVPFEVDLDHRDFVEAMLRRPRHADAAWCSSMIDPRHLATDDKLRPMTAIRRATRPARDSSLLYELDTVWAGEVIGPHISTASCASTSRCGAS